MGMIRSTLIGFGVFLLLNSVTFSVKGESLMSLENKGSTCDNPSTQSEMNQCAGDSYERVDRELNRVYQNVYRNTSGTIRQNLIQAEQAWIQYRDRHCDYEASYFEGGSMQPTIYAGCLESLTRERIEELSLTDVEDTCDATVSCMRNSYQEADQELNQVYQKLYHLNAGNFRKSLISAEQAWIQYRDKNCHYVDSSFEGGTGATYAYYSCLNILTVQRTSHLEDSLNSFNGN